MKPNWYAIIVFTTAALLCILILFWLAVFGIILSACSGCVAPKNYIDNCAKEATKGILQDPEIFDPAVKASWNRRLEEKRREDEYRQAREEGRQAGKSSGKVEGSAIVGGIAALLMATREILPRIIRKNGQNNEK